jgi:hypothetical protein
MPNLKYAQMERERRFLIRLKEESQSVLAQTTMYLSESEFTVLLDVPSDDPRACGDARRALHGRELVLCLSFE